MIKFRRGMYVVRGKNGVARFKDIKEAERFEKGLNPFKAFEPEEAMPLGATPEDKMFVETKELTDD